MHTLWIRLNAVVFFGLTVLLVLSCLAALSKVGHAKRYQPIIHKLELNTLRSLKTHGGVDRALFSFDLHADLRPAFHWNVKQLFVYVVASYQPEGASSENQVVIWDKIVEAIHPEDMVLNADNVYVKYALTDHGQALRDTDVTLTLMWDHMPITGILYPGQQTPESATSFGLPVEYQ